MFKYYLGIDGGGTKTDFVLADSDGNILKHLTLGAANPNDIGIANTLSVIDSGIKALSADINKEKVSVFAGLAGTSGEDYRKIIQTLLNDFGFGRAMLGTDAQNAVASSLGTRDGITVIMGTGAIAFTQKDSQLFRTGGYGYLFDDEGSGYEIAKDAIVAALKDEAGYGEKTLLTELIRKKCDKEKALDNISAFYRGGKKYIAEFAPLVFDAYKSNDCIAGKILNKNMDGIAELIIAASRYLPKRDIDVYLCGGITKQSDTILPIITKALENQEKSFNIAISARSQVIGALILAGMEEK